MLCPPFSATAASLRVCDMKEEQQEVDGHKPASCNNTFCTKKKKKSPDSFLGKKKEGKKDVKRAVRVDNQETAAI